MSLLKYLQTFVILSLIQSGAAWAATYWVSKQGSDSNHCFSSTAEPKLGTQSRLTIKAGAACLGAGDTLMVKPGNYNEHLRNILPNGATLRGADSNPTNWPSLSPQNNVVPHQAAAVAHTQDRTNITYKYIRVDLSSITSGNKPQNCWGSGNAALDPLTIEDFECIGPAPGMMSSTGSGIGTSSAGGYAVIRRGIIKNMISAELDPGAHGLYWQGSNGLMEDVLVENVNGRCINLRSSNGITNNTFRYYFCKDAAKGDVFTDASKTIFHNNVYWNANRVELKNSANTFVNNTIYGTGLHCIRLQGSGHTVLNNIFLNCGSNPALVNESTASTVSHNLTSGTASSIFTDHTKGDFSLKAGSLAIDAGTSVKGIVCKGICDQGAYEFGLSILPSDSQAPAAPGNLHVIAE